MAQNGTLTCSYEGMQHLARAFRVLGRLRLLSYKIDDFRCAPADMFNHKMYYRMWAEVKHG